MLACSAFCQKPNFRIGDWLSLPKLHRTCTEKRCFWLKSQKPHRICNGETVLLVKSQKPMGKDAPMMRMRCSNDEEELFDKSWGYLWKASCGVKCQNWRDHSVFGARPKHPKSATLCIKIKLSAHRQITQVYVIHASLRESTLVYVSRRV